MYVDSIYPYYEELSKKIRGAKKIWKTRCDRKYLIDWYSIRNELLTWVQIEILRKKTARKLTLKEYVDDQQKYIIVTKILLVH